MARTAKPEGRATRASADCSCGWTVTSALARLSLAEASVRAEQLGPTDTENSNSKDA